MPQFLYPDLKQIQPDLTETARYLGYKKLDVPQSEIAEIIASAAEKMKAILQPRCCYEIFDLSIEEINNSGNKYHHIHFADLNFDSVDLGRNLHQCKKVAIFAATIGPQVDAMIRKAEHISSVEAAVLQATGAMYIEKVVDLVNLKIKEEAEKAGFQTRPRYSPGYGDIPLTIQKDFFRLLPCSRIGLSLMNTLIMAPEKSVTAFVGLL